MRANFPIREDLARAHQTAWQRIGRPGTWFDGPTRVAIAAEARHSSQCALCAQQKSSISSNGVSCTHDSFSNLPNRLVEQIHQIATDPGRVTEQWLRSVIAAGTSDAEYVEVVGILATAVALDAFHNALGLPPLNLPTAVPGEPTRRRPATAHQSGEAWLPMIHPRDLESDPNTEEERKLSKYWNGATNKPQRALSLVPEEAYAWFHLVEAQYLPLGVLRDRSQEYRRITRPQIELIASRVSFLNACRFCVSGHIRLLRNAADANGEVYDVEVVRSALDDGNISHGRLFLEFTDAALGADEEKLTRVRAELLTKVSAAALVDAAAVIAAFSGVNRVVSSIGVRGSKEKSAVDFNALWSRGACH